MEININLFKDKIINLVNDISNKCYNDIERRNENGRVSIIDLERVINEYNMTVVPFPEPFEIDINKIYNIEKENKLLVLIDLFTKEEGLSDLTLSILCFLKNDKPVIEINDLRIL